MAGEGKRALWVEESQTRREKHCMTWRDIGIGMELFFLMLHVCLCLKKSTFFGVQESEVERYLHRRVVRVL